jgi:FkbM family methyltransferase
MRLRKRSLRWYASSILRQIWAHPANRGRRAMAVARAIRWQARKRLTSRPVDFTAYGFVVRCYSDSVEASRLHYFGPLYDWEEMGFLSRYLRDGDGFIDGGANIGTYALLAASIVGPSGRVDAFEPVPNAAERLRGNIALNRLEDLIRVHELALGAAPGTGLLSLDWDMANRLVRDAEEMPGQSQEVRIGTLDDILVGNYAAGKLDIEGAEMAALQGAERHLSAANPPVWILEALEHQLRKVGGSRAELLSLLRDHGFRPAVLREGMILEDETESRGFLAIHNASLDEVRALAAAPLAEGKTRRSKV